MIGQEEIREKLLASQNVSNLPNSMLFLGDYGCGKHTMAKELSSHYGLTLLDITKNISHESIEEIYLNPIQAFYLINVDEISERQQNAILKFIEEPLPNSFIILLSSCRDYVLETIVNRCVLYKFRPYLPNELAQFINMEDLSKLDGIKVEDILALCNTPGQVLNLNLKSLYGLNELCETMINKMGQAKYSNTLTIAKKINYKDEYDKYDFKIFLNCYKWHLVNKYIETKNKLYLNLYSIVLEESMLFFNSININKEYFMEHLLTKLWERCRNEPK